MATYKELSLDVDDMILDPNNFRFQDAPDFVFADPTRFAEETVQAKASARLRDEALLPLKQSIVRNGFLPFERLVVTPHESGKYLVLEGNRRLAALRWIRSDVQSGAKVPVELQDTMKAIPVVEVPTDTGDPALKDALMGVRHVSGIKAWGGYQRALLVATLRDKHGLESSDVAQRLGMTVHEVNRRYRALKALQQMMESENFSDAARPEMYPLFHEAVSLPSVREWLEWDDSACLFQNQETTDEFYSLITPASALDEETKSAKITTYSDVRDLRMILANTEARKVLNDPTRSLTEALAITKRQDIVNSWKAEVSEAMEALKGIGSYELKRLEDDDVGLLKSLEEVVSETIAAVDALKAL